MMGCCKQPVRSQLSIAAKADVTVIVFLKVSFIVPPLSDVIITYYFVKYILCYGVLSVSKRISAFTDAAKDATVSIAALMIAVSFLNIFV